jgi:hypothetical protein
VVKKLEKRKTAPKITSQPSKKQVQNKKDERVEYAKSVFLNVRRSHIKSGIGYKNSDKHNSRVELVTSRSRVISQTCPAPSPDISDLT